MSPRALVKEGSSGPDVVDAILRLNLAGANPQLFLSETFDAAATRCGEAVFRRGTASSR
jgi:hypothetical protein